jgi:hypothetical protein
LAGCDTFNIVVHSDEKAHGEYLTTRLIVDSFAPLGMAIDSGDPYRTVLNSPPADPAVAHALGS